MYVHLFSLSMTNANVFGILPVMDIGILPHIGILPPYMSILLRGSSPRGMLPLHTFIAT